MAKVSLGAIYASQVFQNLLEQSKDRLAHGMKLRAALHAQIQAGIPPTGYRADFLNDTSYEIVERLCAVAEKFNQEHPDDMCSTADFLDILATTRNRILRGVEESQVKATDPKPETED